MVKKKNYLSNNELKEEILNCITAGYNKAVKNGFDSTLPVYDDGNSESDVDYNDKTIKLGYIFNSDDNEVIEKYNMAIKNGYVPERSYWIRLVREFDKLNEDEINRLISSGEYNESIKLQMAKPIVSDKLAYMFQLIVENIARSFYWSNPDDGLDCKANAILDLCSNFWKYEPVDINGRPYSAFAFCSQIAYFGIAGAHRILHPKKYNGTISLSCLDDNGKTFELYNI